MNTMLKQSRMLRCSCISSVPFHPPNFSLTLLHSTLSSPPFLHMAPAFSLPIPHPHSTPPLFPSLPFPPSFLPSLPPPPPLPPLPPTLQTAVSLCYISLLHRLFLLRLKRTCQDCPIRAAGAAVRATSPLLQQRNPCAARKRRGG